MSLEVPNGERFSESSNRGVSHEASPEGLSGEIFSTIDVNPLDYSHLYSLHEMFQYAAVPPGRVVTRSWFPHGLAPIPVQVVSSELVDINLSEGEVKTVFVQHFLESDERQKYEYAQRQYCFNG